VLYQEQIDFILSCKNWDLQLKTFKEKFSKLTIDNPVFQLRKKNFKSGCGRLRLKDEI
jgi:hypothetical protein